MDMKGALRARLLAAGPVTALVGQRVYWVDRPQATALPGITLTSVVDRRHKHMGGFHSRQLADVQLDIWANTYSEGVAIQEAVIAALSGASTANGIKFGPIPAFDVNDRGERVETKFIHNPQLTFTVNYSPA